MYQRCALKIHTAEFLSYVGDQGINFGFFSNTGMAVTTFNPNL